ncbi:GAF domain-containing protein [Pseudothermotoga thermarum]|uniref:GAF domain-containing protein n=1 Tax=Pseudothermotoga thermarum DSM 5069 TaxID=688269 RepID=F7YUX7_9THEM|nr:GAF domain-containing protein [Pseudothermotoga thermarum]AEH51539.1 hypothetical protein Theth_1482 [Pseudothermotoga thermarum DSM 5069]
MRVYEIFIFSGLIFLVDIVFKYYGYLTADINPYVLFAVYVAARYGLMSSLILTFLSTLLTILSVYMHYGKAATQIVLSWATLRVPLLILMISIVAGILTDLRERKIRDLENELVITRNTIKEYKQNLEKYETITNTLQKRIVLEEGVSAFVEKLRQIELYNREDIFNQAIDLISKFIEATTISIYLLSSNNFLRLRVRKGPGFLPNSFPMNRSLVVSKSAELGVFSVADLYFTSENVDFSIEPAISVAIRSQEKVFGFILVEVISPEHLNRSTQTYLQVLADWLASLLEISSDLTNLVVTDDEMKFYSFLLKISERYEKYKIPYSVIHAKLGNSKEFDELKRLLRETDFVLHKEGELRIILTVCGEDGLKRVLERLQKVPSLTIEEAYSRS